MEKSQLVICGSVAFDRIMSFEGRYSDLIHRDKLDVLSISVLADNLKIAPGGNAANITHSLALLGEKPVLLGSVGQDAADYLARLSATGVDTSQVHISDLATASFHVLTDGDNNQVGGFYPGAMGDSSSLSLGPWQGKSAVVCVSAHDPATMRAQVRQCAELGLTLVYDPGQQVSNVAGDDLKAGLLAAEIVIVNEYEQGLLAEKTGLSIDELHALVPIFITTHGEKGSVISGKSVAEPIIIASAKPAQIVDPTGAGDGYRAGFLYGYLRQWELSKCGQVGSVVASLILEDYGPQQMFTPAVVAQRYHVTFNQEITV